MNEILKKRIEEARIEGSITRWAYLEDLLPDRKEASHEQ